MDKEERIITLTMVKHDVGVFFAKKPRRLAAGVILAAVGLIALYCMPSLNGYSAGTMFAISLSNMLAWFAAITGTAVFFSNIRKFALTRYIAAAAASAAIILMLISARGVLSAMDITVKIDFVQGLFGEIVENLPVFAAALTGSALAGHVCGRKIA